MHLAQRLAYLRALAGISNRELDKRAGVTQCHSWSIETGRRPNPELRTLKLLAAALGCSVGYLADGDGEPPTAAEVRAVVDSFAEHTHAAHAQQ